MVASASSGSSGGGRLLSSIAGSYAELWLQSCNICSQLMLAAAAAAVEQKVRRRGVYCRLCYVVCMCSAAVVLHKGPGCSA